MTGRSRTLLLAVLLVVVTAVYFGGLWGGFVWDDRTYFIENDILPRLGPGDIVAIFTRPSNTWGEHLPVRDWLYVVEYRLFGRDPFGYHVVSLILYLFVGLAAYALLYALYARMSATADGRPFMGKPDIQAFLVTAFFMLHPVHVESVAYISGQKDLLFALFTLMTLYFTYAFSVRRQWRPGNVCVVAVLYYLSVLSRSTAVATLLFLPVLWLMYLRSSEDKLLRPAVVWTAVNVPVVLWLYHATTTPQIAGVHGSIQGMLGMAPLQLILRALRILGAHAALAVKPYPLNFGYPFNEFVWVDANLLFGCIALAGVLALVVLRRRTIEALGALIFFFYLFPVLQIFVSLWSATVYDRYLMIPILGVGMILEASLRALVHAGMRLRKVAVAVWCCILLTLGVLTFDYVPAFRSDVASTGHAYAEFPGWPSAAFNYTYSLIEAGRFNEALQMVRDERSLLDPPWVKPYFIGWVYLEQGEVMRATEFLLLSSSLCMSGGYFPFPNIPLARALIAEGDYERAEQYLKDVLASRIFQPLELYRARKLLLEAQRAREKRAGAKAEWPKKGLFLVYNTEALV